VIHGFCDKQLYYGALHLLIFRFTRFFYKYCGTLRLGLKGAAHRSICRKAKTIELGGAAHRDNDYLKARHSVGEVIFLLKIQNFK
jgi:hypothetical protein